MKRLVKGIIIYIFLFTILFHIKPFNDFFTNKATIESIPIEIKESMEVMVKSFNKSVIQESNYAENQVIMTEDFTCLNISIEDSIEKVLKELGEPQRIDLSKYGFEWYIYNKDYSKYMQVGIEDGKVVGLCSNSPIWESENGLKIGSKREEVEKVLGKPIEYIKKDDTLYYINTPEENSTYLINNYYITFFYDIHDEYKVSAIKIIERTMEESLKGFYGMNSERLRESFEMEIFDLANATRVRLGKPPFIWGEEGRSAGRKHSMNMAKRGFFNHVDPHGRGPAHRIEEEGVSWQKVGENIAAGQTSPIFAHENWMNSMGHRENLLGDFKNLGVGVYFGGDYHVYYTQKFFTTF